MFTTGDHRYLYVACGLYTATFVLSLAGRRRTAQGGLLAGLVLHGLYLAGRGWLTGIFYANPIFEGPFFLPWCMAAATSIASIRRDSIPIAPLVGAVVAFTVVAIAYSKGAIPPTPKKTTLLAAVFFFTEVGGHALFYCGAVLAVGEAVGRRASSDHHDIVVWGFVLYSVSQVVGAAWCYQGWGNTFSFSPRHFTSAAIWLIYAAYLHLRFTPGWTSRRRTIFLACASSATLAATYGHYLNELSFPRIGG